MSEINNIQATEKKAVLIALPAYIFMGVAGIYFATLTNSSAIMVDGAFNLINAIVSLLALRITYLIGKGPSKQFPLGWAALEPMFVLLKASLILGIIIMTSISSIYTMYLYAIGEHVEPITMGFVSYYIGLMVVICIGLYFLFKHFFNKSYQQSQILNAEASNAIINAIITSCAGVALILISLLEGTFLSFLTPIADSIVVLLLNLILVRDPWLLWKNGFEELVGKSAASDLRQNIQKNIGAVLKHDDFGMIMTKLGRTAYIVININLGSESISGSSVKKDRYEIEEVLKNEFSFYYLAVEYK